MKRPLSLPASRRRFLSTSAAAASALSLGAYVNISPAQESKSPNEKLNFAAVGATGRAAEDIRGCASQNIVAIADCDSAKLDQGAKAYAEARKYQDFRKMLEAEGDKINGVIVGTPDHTHAPAAAMALRMGKHCYCEKPLTHTVFEARTLANLAQEKKLVTQMGNQIHAGDNYRRVVELIQAGAIGDVTEAHVWVSVDYSGGKFTSGKPCPPNLDWDLWQGPAAEHEHSDNVHPFNWRRFWAYGTGGIGDFFCHYVDLVHWALDLKHPTAIETKGPAIDPVSCSAGLVATFDYPAREKMPAVKVTWYDGKERPKLYDELVAADESLKGFGSGQLFVGSKGMLIANYGSHKLLPTDKFVDFKRPDPTIPRSIGHHEEWINAIKTGGPTTCNFDYAGALTEAALLGVVAYRAGQKIEWDAANLKVKNLPAAQQWVHKEYRKGWTL